MVYEAKKFDQLLGMEGFSDRALNNHFTLYEGYVKNVNKAVDSMVELLDKDKSDTPEFAEVTRRFGWEFNGMRLHEIYFGGMKQGGSKLDMDSPLGKKLIKEF